MKKNPYLLIILCICFSISMIVPSQAATLTGTIKYDGKPPKFRPIKMDADPICLTHHDESVYPQTLVLGEDQAMANVFVHITRGLTKKDYPVPTEPIILNQKGCAYTPHVFGVRTGQPIKILNPDGTLHNVHALPKINPEFNLAMPKFRKEVTKTFDKAEFMFPIKCDVHPWMGTWCAVMDHPYFAVTSEDGRFEISDLPAGEYELEAWHEKLGKQTLKITVSDGENKELDVTFSRPQKPAK